MNMKKTSGLAFFILWIIPVVSHAQSQGTPPGIDPAAADKLKSQIPALTDDTKRPKRIADDQMSCVQINEEISKIMMRMEPEADALDSAATRAETVIKEAQLKGGVYTAGQVEQRKQETQPALTDLHSAAANLATANTASGGMARVGVLMRLSKDKKCAHAQGIPQDILDESGDEPEP